MKEYRIQYNKDGQWEMADPAYIFYIHLEKAQEDINERVRNWKRYNISEYANSALANPENWRIVQREVTEWKPVTED